MQAVLNFSGALRVIGLFAEPMIAIGAAIYEIANRRRRVSGKTRELIFVCLRERSSCEANDQNDKS